MVQFKSVLMAVVCCISESSILDSFTLSSAGLSGAQEVSKNL